MQRTTTWGRGNESIGQVGQYNFSAYLEEAPGEGRRRGPEPLSAPGFVAVMDVRRQMDACGPRIRTLLPRVFGDMRHAPPVDVTRNQSKCAGVFLTNGEMVAPECVATLTVYGPAQMRNTGLLPVYEYDRVYVHYTRSVDVYRAWSAGHHRDMHVIGDSLVGLVYAGARNLPPGLLAATTSNAQKRPDGKTTVDPNLSILRGLRWIPVGLVVKGGGAGEMLHVILHKPSRVLYGSHY